MPVEGMGAAVGAEPSAPQPPAAATSAQAQIGNAHTTTILLVLSYLASLIWSEPVRC
jgi:hypothetical protein